jgi:iron complex outermembrane receptor protein
MAGDLPLAIAGAVSVLVAQPAWAQVVQVTAVRLSSTPDGLEILLQTTDGASTLVQSSSSGQRFITEITNAQLALPGGNLFRQDNPTGQITSVTVAPLDTNRIQVTVTGKTGAPTGQVFLRQGQGLVVRLAAPGATTEKLTPSPTPSPAPQAEDLEPIELVVTAEREAEGYSVPEATTATRTDTPLRDIPQSIQVVPRQVLEDQQVTRIGEAARNVSSVTPKPGYGGSNDNYTIRGFEVSTNLRNGFRDDGFYSFTDPANIEQVEVLKGPASVLYGEFEPGGLVNYITKQPLSQPYYSSQFTIGSYDFYRPSFDISGPLNSDKTLLYRLNFAYENSGSFRDFVDKQLSLVAPVLTFKISDATTLTLEYEYINLNQTFDRGFPPLKESFRLPINRYLGEPSDSYEFSAHKISYTLNHQFSDSWQLRNAFSAQIVDSLRSNVQARTFQLEDDGRTLQRLYTKSPAYNQVYSLQTDLIGNIKTGSVEHQLLLGLELSKITDQFSLSRAAFPSIDIFDPVYGFPIPTKFDSGISGKTTTDNLAIYLQDQITLLPNLKLLAGGRFDFIDLNKEDVADIINGSEPETTTRDYRAFSPRVGLVYQPIEPISLYASYSRSFKPNTFAFSAPGQLLEPERGTQYEVGIKTDLLDDRLSATLAAYEITKTNVATPNPNDIDFSIAAGAVKSRGLEFDIAGELFPGWNIIASYGFNDAYVSKDNDKNLVGDRLINAPRHTASLWTTYELQSGSLQGLGFGGGVFFVGDREAALPNTLTIPAYVRTDATIFYRRDNWRIALNIKNLFDIKYYDSQGFLLYPGAPLTALGTFSVEF